MEASSPPSVAAVADTVSPVEVIDTWPGTTARLRSVELVRATPAPIAAVPPVAEPSAALEASAAALVERVTVPPATMEVTSIVMSVSAVTVEMTTPTAAAAPIEPSEVSAAGGLAELASLRSCLAATSSEKPR